MRIATWNCQPGLESNWAAIEEINADVLAIQEARSGSEALVESHAGWTCVWRPGTYYPGLAVLARDPFAVPKHSEPSEPFAISTIITGPERFRLVNFWAMTPANVGDIPYTGQARRVIEQLPEDGLPTVVAGDFNHSKNRFHLANVTRLNERGLVSAYHTYHQLSHTEQEGDMTRYAAGRDGPAYHIDFVFVPAAWSVTKVEVGTFDQYPGRARSDHVPVVVTVQAATGIQPLAEFPPPEAP